ncbi:MAG TPA: C25 family cysteine peptidase, partial [Ignavibacteria bacterium]|nr:C25 family cysteine peptidase [Ignavibacteria bacterium]
MKRIFTLCVIISFLSGLVLSQPVNTNLRVQQISNGYEVEFSLPQLSSTTINQSGENYINYQIEGLGITPEPGLPMLPQLSFNLIIGSAEVSPGYDVISKSVQEKYLDKKIYPTQEPWEKSKSLDDRPFTINREYYSTSGSINSPFVRISEPFIIAGVKAVTVTIFPFNYDPSANRLVISNSARLKINLSSGLPYYQSVPESFKELFSNLFVNPGVLSYTPTNNYLIITPPEYESTMSSFASYKTGMGYNVLMVNTGATGTTNTSILNYIQNRYNNITTRPEFILLAGDIDKIPEWTGIGSDNPHTDLNYTLLEGNDVYADAFIGRFPVANTSQLTNAINKSIYMESSIGGLPRKNIYMASNDNYTISEGTHNFVIDSFFAPANYTNLKLYSHTYGATTQQLIDALNANQTYAIYSGHGSVTSWADGPPLSQSQVNALTNTVFPFVYSFACLTGQFQNPECFGETWIRGPKAGAVFWGSSVNSFWDEDDILEKRLFRAKFVDGLKKTAPMFVMGKYYLVQYYGSVTTTMRRYLEMYNCFGDPSIYQAAFGPVISHTPLPNTENLLGPYTVNCTIIPAGSNIDPSRTRLFWTRGTNFNDSVSM